jgi:uncharacterized membrane protein YfcA
VIHPANAIGLGAAALAAGLVNALAGGGSLLSFPALTAAGLPALVANLTNTVALTPGNLGATLGQRQQLRSQARRLATLLPAAGLGGLLGALLLLHTTEKLFYSLVPWLLLLGSGLLWAQPPLRRWIVQRLQRHGPNTLSERQAILPVLLASIYGGYFGAGLGVIVLAVLALTLEDSITRLNGLKQALSLACNSTAACVFIGSGQVRWGAVALMAAGALLGGALGGRLAGKVNPDALRAFVVIAGVVLALFYFGKLGHFWR